MSLLLLKKKITSSSFLMWKIINTLNWNLRAQSSSILPCKLYHQLSPQSTFQSEGPLLISKIAAYIHNAAFSFPLLSYSEWVLFILEDQYYTLSFCETISDHFASLESTNLQISLALLIYFWRMNTLSLNFRTISFTPSPTSRPLYRITQLSYLKYSTIHFFPLST